MAAEAAASSSWSRGAARAVQLGDRDQDTSVLRPNPRLSVLGPAGDRHSQTPTGSGGTEVPKPLLRSRPPAPRPGGDEPRPPSEGRPEAEVGRLVARLQDGAAKPGKAANGLVASPALRTNTLQARRPAPRPGIHGREGERGLCRPGDSPRCPGQTWCAGPAGAGAALLSSSPWGSSARAGGTAQLEGWAGTCTPGLGPAVASPVLPFISDGGSHGAGACWGGCCGVSEQPAELGAGASAGAGAASPLLCRCQHIR